AGRAVPLRRGPVSSESCAASTRRLRSRKAIEKFTLRRYKGWVEELAVAAPASCTPLLGRRCETAVEARYRWSRHGRRGRPAIGGSQGRGVGGGCGRPARRRRGISARPPP